jgi:hypothetical protein
MVLNSLWRSSRRLARGWGILLCFFIIILTGQAQPRLSVEADEQVIALDGFLHIRYNIENAGEVTAFFPPAFTPFEVLQGPDQSSGWTLINGEMKQYVSFGFVLRPTSKGQFTIPPARAKADGKMVRSAPLAVEVNDLGPAPFSRYPEPDRSSLLQDQFILKKGESIDKKIEGNLFVRLEVSKKTVYVGEPLVATYKLYTRLNSESRVVKRPSLSGFSVFDMIEPESGQALNEKLGDRDFNVYILRKTQLYPLQEGAFELEPMEVENKVSFIRGEMMGDENSLSAILRIYGEEALQKDAWIKKQVSRSSLPVTITVKGLPEQDRPPLFNGAVGKFGLDLKPDRKDIRQGELFNLILRVSGTGNLPVLEQPVVSLPPAFESYDVSVSDDLDKEQSPIKGSKTYTIPLVAKDTGRFIIPAVELAQFVPAIAVYQQIRSDSIQVRVLPATKEMAARKQGPLVEAKDGSNISDTQLITAGLLLIVALFVAILIFFKAGRKRKAMVKRPPLPDPGPIVLPEPDQKAVSQTISMEAARLALAQKNASLFYREMRQTIRLWLENNFGIERNENSHYIAARLREAGMEEAMIGTVLQLLADSQTALYSPIGLDEKMNSDIEKLEYLYEKFAG